MAIDPKRQLSVFEVVDFLRVTGWGHSTWATAAAVFRAESGWDPRATSYQPNADGSVDRGLVQLNSRYFPDEALAFDPARAVAKARELHAARGFGPWYAHTNGSYCQFLPECEAAVDGRPLPYPGKVVVAGSAGIPARTVSFLLRRRGWGVPLSSVCTPAIAAAVAAFQREKRDQGHDIGAVDAKVGPKTFLCLQTCPVT